jgi:hypothetical protein
VTLGLRYKLFQDIAQVDNRRQGVPLWRDVSCRLHKIKYVRVDPKKFIPELYAPSSCGPNRHPNCVQRYSLMTQKSLRYYSQPDLALEHAYQKVLCVEREWRSPIPIRRARTRRSCQIAFQLGQARQTSFDTLGLRLVSSSHWVAWMNRNALPTIPCRVMLSYGTVGRRNLNGLLAVNASRQLKEGDDAY